MKKKTWTVPELIVLVRSKPEEAVMQACKTFGLETSSGNSQAGCQVEGFCTNCDDHGAS
jgi:hypothetical protein